MQTVWGNREEDFKDKSLIQQSRDQRQLTSHAWYSKALSSVVSSVKKDVRGFTANQESFSAIAGIYRSFTKQFLSARKFGYGSSTLATQVRIWEFHASRLVWIERRVQHLCCSHERTLRRMLVHVPSDERQVDMYLICVRSRTSVDLSSSNCCKIEKETKPRKRMSYASKRAPPGEPHPAHMSFVDVTSVLSLRK